MDQKLDFRVQRTYRLLINSLMDLLREKCFDEISVRELCDRAMIRRSTFYKHFADKYELFTFTVRELMRQFAQENQLVRNQKRPKTFYAAMIDRSLQFLEQHSDVFSSVIKSQHAQILLDILSEEIERDVLAHLKADEAGGAILPAKAELLAAVMTGALIYTMRWWVVHDMKMPREELIRVYTSLVRIE